MFVQRVVEIGDVGLVMLPVVDLHRLRVNVRLEGGEIVRQRGQYVSRLGCSRPLFFYLCHREYPGKFRFQTPHCATQFPPYLGSADVLSSPISGGARGGVPAALAALSGRHYVDRPALLLQLCTGPVRGGAIVTFLTGILIIAKHIGESPLGAAAWSTPWAITILTGALFGTLMFVNVVLVIWPKQQIVIASAKAAASGGQANAAAPVAARRAFLASRTNVVFSIPMLFYMGAASHFTLPGGGNHAAYWAAV